MPEPRTSRTMLLGVALAFIVPLILAILFYGFRHVLPVPGPRVHGDLIQPARPVVTLGMTTAAGDALTADYLRGKWTLIYLADGQCDQICGDTIVKSRQVRLALGRRRARVQRLFLTMSDSKLDDLDAMTAEHPFMTIATVSPKSRTAALEWFRDQPSNAVYVVDPLGNLMMRYGPDATHAGILKDLKRLLRVSQIG